MKLSDWQTLFEFANLKVRPWLDNVDSREYFDRLEMHGSRVCELRDATAQRSPGRN